MVDRQEGGDPGRTAIFKANQRPAQSHPANAPLGKLRVFSGHCPTLFLLAALAFDAHILLLSWGAERQERIPATSAETCRAAIEAIAAGRWLADDPPAGMRCERGNAFAPGWDCIEGFNCGPRR
jgi:hypothetical protein